jgi:hypothetical protein
MVEFAHEFGNRESPGTYVVDFETKGYEKVPGMDATVWSQIVTNRDRFGDWLSRGGVSAEAEALYSPSSIRARSPAASRSGTGRPVAGSRSDAAASLGR